MRKKPLLTTVQLMFLIVGSALIFPYTFMPILTTPPANQDAWITLLMSLFYIIILSAPLLFIINRFRGVNTNQTIEMVLGDKVGRVMTLFFILFFFFCETA